ncbi:MAG: 2-oxoacid:acceptor oxidoreductase subunit alpha [Elusimicrobia bacterium]|nr:2-oxoacid:acceptor oxidoreductase subunit alpha [Elusimicrobiota bacterium]
MAKTSIIICGQAGQGIQTVCNILAKAILRSGYYVFAWQDFQSRIRGGESSSRLVLSDMPVESLPEKYDILVSLDKSNTSVYLPFLKKDGIAVAEDETGENILAVPFQKTAVEIGGNKIYANASAIGTIAGIINLGFERIETVLREEFTRKSNEIADKNVLVAKYSYDWAVKNSKKYPTETKGLKNLNMKVMTGNESLALGAIAGGCKFMSAYPMTPSTGIITYLSETSHKTGILTEQAEDEISAINMVIGASYAGVRSLTATSGGGFCLMVEGLSLAAMTETPVVIVLGQRPGPATGLPTRTEQGELNFALNAAHGEFPRFIFAPSNAYDAFNIMIKAFEMSQKYRVPVIILTDQYLADSYWTVKNFNIDKVEIKDYFSNPNDIAGEFKKYSITDDGLSPRLKPGESENLVVDDSDEHDQYGHITENNTIRKLMVEKRWNKNCLMAEEMNVSVPDGIEDSELVLVSWGSNGGIVSYAVDVLLEKGIRAKNINYTEIWPLKIPKEFLDKNRKFKIVVIENNFTGQFARLLESEGVKIYGKILKYDGLPFTEDEVIEEVLKYTSVHPLNSSFTPIDGR